MATSYDILASESTVQVLSATLTQEVLVVTMTTKPTGVIATCVIPAATFALGGPYPGLTVYAVNIEKLMARDDVIAATGVQTVDANGLLVDQVSFTVQYIPPDTTGTAITAQALVPNTLLQVDWRRTDVPGFAEAEAIIQAVHDGLASADTG